MSIILSKTKVKDGQFLITKSDVCPKDAKEKIALKNWNVFLFEDVNTINVIDPEGNLIGFFIGRLIDYKAGTIISGEIKFSYHNNNWEKKLEDFIYQFGGSYLFVLSYNNHERVYLDANGSKSLVYDYSTRTVASTAGTFLEDEQYLSRFNLELYQFLDVANDGWFPSGLTAHHGVQRLLCNHYLDLESFNAVRHWPKNDFDFSSSTAEIALKIAEIVKHVVKIFVNDGNTICALTGGNESRFILAACSSMLDELEFCTVDAPFTKRDVYIAKKIAKKLGLKHRLLPLKMASIDEQHLWQYQGGHCVGGLNMLMHPTVREISNYKYFIGGLGGEIGRAFFWRPSDNTTMQLKGKDIVGRFGMRSHFSVVEATNQWLLSVKDFNPLTQLDLAYMELRMSAWGFAHYANPLAKSEFHPMVCREVYTLMMQLSADAKRHNLFIKEGVNQLCPQLADLPVNRYGNYRDLLELVGKVSDIKRVKKKFRKLGFSK